MTFGGNPVSRFYCPEKETGMINQREDEDPSPSRSRQPQRTHGLSERPGSVPQAESPEGSLRALSPIELQTEAGII